MDVIPYDLRFWAVDDNRGILSETHHRNRAREVGCRMSVVKRKYVHLSKKSKSYLMTRSTGDLSYPVADLNERKILGRLGFKVQIFDKGAILIRKW